MCGRFFLTSELKEVKERFKAESVDDFRTGTNIAPSQEITIIKDNKITLAHWGFPMANKDVINARIESVEEKNLFKDSYENRHCLIPANGFIEWKDKQPFKVEYKDGLIAFAGIYKEKDGKTFVTILTTEAEGELTRVHHRTPVTIKQSDEDKWLLGAPVKHIVHPISVKRLDKKINSARNTDPTLLNPVTTLDSF
jgi:putative SOS response-associated peptidase YedK